MKLTEEEIDALRAYFDVTNINISILIRKIGLKKVNAFQKVINTVYENSEE
jgi:hypothetical protein